MVGLIGTEKGLPAPKARLAPSAASMAGEGATVNVSVQSFVPLSVGKLVGVPGSTTRQLSGGLMVIWKIGVQSSRGPPSSQPGMQIKDGRRSDAKEE